MKGLIAGIFLFASLVKLAPVVGFLFPSQIPNAYGIAVDDPNLLILLRHRAGLFAIVGVLLALAAFRPRMRVLGAAVGLFSMLSFNLVVLLDGPANSQLSRYAAIDLVAAVGLVGALVLDQRLRSRNTTA